MNFGFIGSQSELQLIQPAFGPQSTHRLVAVLIEVDELPAASLPSTSPAIGTRYTNYNAGSFGDLLGNSQLDAVLVGGPIAERVSRLRQLLQLGRHCVCMHPAETSPLEYHEVAMIAQDHGATLMPWLPGRLHPACQALAEWCRAPDIGVQKCITIERSGRIPINRLLTAASYAEAVDILWFLAGDVAEISSTGDAQVGRLVVHHRMNAGASGEIRLQRSDEAADSWTLVIDAERAAARLIFQNGLAGPAMLWQSDETGIRETEYPAPGLASLLLDEFHKAVHHQPCAIQWPDAIRTAELADWAWYSLERRRAVDIFHEERGELASFKGRMTSLGCGLIWITLFVLILIAVGKGLNLPGMDGLAWATVIVWLLFVLFQGLRWALPDTGER